MARTTSDGEFRLATRRALRAWLRTLEGQGRIDQLTPMPNWYGRRTRQKPDPLPAEGRIELSVRPRADTAGERIVARRFSLRLPSPAQWAISSNFKLPCVFSPTRRLGMLFRPVGLDTGGFWCSGDELFVREHPPQVEVVEPEYDLEFFDYCLTDPADLPPAAWWLEVALQAGFGMAQIDDRGFVVPTGTSDEDGNCGWEFAERRPMNLHDPLSFNVHVWPSGRLSFQAHSIHEMERAEKLQAALLAAVEKLPGLRVHSGNCTFTIEEWKRLFDGAKPEQAPTEEESLDNVVALDARRRR